MPSEIAAATPLREQLEPEPLPANIKSTQPGGGLGYAVETAFGRLRRAYLKRCRKGYVARMAALRQGSDTGAPHEILDTRDLKFARNQCTCDWPPQHDPFAWRESIPFARWGLCELQLFGWPLLAITALLGWLFWPAAIATAIVLAIIVYFFRDPPRRIPQESGCVVSPADGTVTTVEKIAHHEFVGGPAVRISIFLSLFNVHLNRAPVRGRVIRLHYAQGEFVSATRADSAERNENMTLYLQMADAPYYRVVLKQIAGQVARRIVCAARPGELLERGQKFGMIKLGSRTDLWLPDVPKLEVLVKPGDKLTAGSQVIARLPHEG